MTLRAHNPHARSLPDLGIRHEGKSDLSQFLFSFCSAHPCAPPLRGWRENSFPTNFLLNRMTIRLKRGQKMAKVGFSAVAGPKSGRLLAARIMFDVGLGQRLTYPFLGRGR